jgi:hypothetical protein
MARLVRAVRILLRDGRVPRPLRWLTAFALAPIPGPVDELVLLIVAPSLFVFRREALRDAWQQAART